MEGSMDGQPEAIDRGTYGGIDGGIHRGASAEMDGGTP